MRALQAKTVPYPTLLPYCIPDDPAAIAVVFIDFRNGAVIFSFLAIPCRDSAWLIYGIY